MLFVIALFIVFVLALCVWLVGCYWWRLMEIGCFAKQTSLWAWCFKGLAIPFLIWIGYNFLLIPGRVATVPAVVLAQADSQAWTRIGLELMLPAVPVVASCWAAATLAWLVMMLVQHTESRKEILGAGLFWGLVLSPFAALILWLFGWSGVAVALLLLLAPVLWDLTVLGTPRKLMPVYERALERLNRGEHTAAEMEILRQLERGEDDFEGWMLLAGVYAKHFGDLAEAERTVREICRQPSITRREYCAALMQLGEWHLQLHFDASAAGAVWREICERFPHTEYADIARRRINSLGGAA